MSCTMDWSVLREQAEQELFDEQERYRRLPSAHRRRVCDEARAALREIKQREALATAPGFRSVVRRLAARLYHAA